MENGPQSQEMIVQLLRYKFRMSGHLKNAFRTLLVPNAPRKEVFFYATRQVFTDELWAHDVNKKLQLAQAYFQNDELKPPLLLRDKQPLSVYGLQNGMGKVAMYPADQAVFDAMTGPLANIDSLVPSNSKLNNYYAHIPGHYMLPDSEERDAALAALEKHVSNPSEQRYFTMQRVDIAQDSVRIPRRDVAA